MTKMKMLASFELQANDPTVAPCRIVLVDTEAGYHPLVTWLENTANGGRVWGHYFSREQETEARADFMARVKRGY